jgi:hypothetical protein
VDSKEYKEMKKVILAGTMKRLAKGARSKAKEKSPQLKWPTKSERTALIKVDDWDKAQATFQKQLSRGHGHLIERARIPLPRRAPLRAASL